MKALVSTPRDSASGKTYNGPDLFVRSRTVQNQMTSHKGHPRHQPRQSTFAFVLVALDSPLLVAFISAVFGIRCRLEHVCQRMPDFDTKVHLRPKSCR